jgi:hypothetical protein
VIDKSLEKDADSRYATAGLMADELTRVRDRYPTPHLEDQDVAALSQARKNLASNRPDPAILQAVEAIALAHPDATEAQRLRRLYKRKPTDPHSIVETAAFPELDATFGRAAARGEETLRSGQTVSGSAETILQGGGRETVVVPPGAARPSKALMVGAIAAVVVAGSLGALLYFSRGSAGPNSAKPTPTITEIFVPGSDATPEKSAPSAPPPARTAAPVAAVPKSTIEIVSRPPGASIRIDRKAVGVTPLRTEVASNTAHSVVLALPGYQSREIRVDLPIPATVEATLVAEGPPATLVVESAYPLTVSVAGRVLAADKAGLTVTLSAGPQEVLLESASIFLKRRETVQLEAGGSVTIKAPDTGKLGVRATPDNCKIFVNGIFVDYPPIMDRTIVAGSHVVSFEWPDGTKAEEKVQVQAGKPSYVMGRKP